MGKRRTEKNNFFPSLEPKYWMYNQIYALIVDSELLQNLLCLLS